MGTPKAVMIEQLRWFAKEVRVYARAARLHESCFLLPVKEDLS
jgi:hypothetical protein